MIIRPLRHLLHRPAPATNRTLQGLKLAPKRVRVEAPKPLVCAKATNNMSQETPQAMQALTLDGKAPGEVSGIPCWPECNCAPPCVDPGTVTTWPQHTMHDVCGKGFNCASSTHSRHCCLPRHADGLCQLLLYLLVPLPPSESVMSVPYLISCLCPFSQSDNRQ